MNFFGRGGAYIYIYVESYCFLIFYVLFSMKFLFFSSIYFNCPDNPLFKYEQLYPISLTWSISLSWQTKIRKKTGFVVPCPEVSGSGSRWLVQQSELNFLQEIKPWIDRTVNSSLVTTTVEVFVHSLVDTKPIKVTGKDWTNVYSYAKNFSYYPAP